MSLPPPSDPIQQLQWLVDRAAIADVLVDFARALDTRDWGVYEALFAEDAVLSVPGMRHEGRAGLAEAVGGGLGRFAGTHHLVGNIAVEVDGDTARSRSYLLAAHLLDADDPTQHADGAGWYDNTYRRTSEGWRLTSVALTVRYLSGQPIPSMSPV